MARLDPRIQQVRDQALQDPAIIEAVRATTDFKSRKMDQKAWQRVIQRIAGQFYAVTGQPYVQMLDVVAQNLGLESEFLGLISGQPSMPPAETPAEAVIGGGLEIATFLASFATPGGALKLAGKAGSKALTKIAPKAVGRAAGAVGTIGGISVGAVVPERLQQGATLPEAGRAAAQAPVDLARSFKDLPGKLHVGINRWPTMTAEEKRQFVVGSGTVAAMALLGVQAFRRAPRMVYVEATSRELGRPTLKTEKGRLVEPKDLSDGDLIHEFRYSGDTTKAVLRPEIRKRMADPKFKGRFIDVIVRNIEEVSNVRSRSVEPAPEPPVVRPELRTGPEGGRRPTGERVVPGAVSAPQKPKPVLAPQKGAAPESTPAPGRAVAKPPKEAPQPEARQPWEMTRKEYRSQETRPKFDAIAKAVGEGKTIILSTHLRATKLTKPEHVRFTESGNVQIPEGRKWVTLTDEQVDQLARQAGISPVPLQKRVLHGEEVKRAVRAGKAVPPEVLKDYPELAKPVAKPAAKEPSSAPARKPEPAAASVTKKPALKRAPQEIVLKVEDLPSEPFTAAGIRSGPGEPERGKTISVGGSRIPQTWIKKFAATVPGFKKNPVFTVKGGKLVHTDGARFTLEPKMFGIDPDTLVEGDTVRIDLAKPKKPSPSKAPGGGAKKGLSAEDFEQKYHVIRSTGFIPPRAVRKGLKGFLSEETAGVREARPIIPVARAIVPTAKAIQELSDPTGDITDYSVKATRRRESAFGRRLLRQLRGRVGKAGEETRLMAKLFKRMETGTPEELLDMHSAMVGNLPITSLPRDAQGWVMRARAMHDEASMTLLGELLKTYGKTTLSTSIRKNIGTYLHESLIPTTAIAELKALVSRKRRLQPGQFKFKRDKWAIAVGRSHFKFDSEVEAREAYNALLRQQLTKVIRKKALERGVSATDLKKAAAAKKVKLVSPIPEEVRQKMFIRNPLAAWAISYMKTRHNAETLRVFRMMNKRFGEDPPDEVTSAGEQATQEWAKDEGLAAVKGDKKVVGPLAGRYLPKPLARDINELVRLPNMLERWYMTYLGGWKSAKTIWNPPTHIRNIIGNVMFADFAGIAPYYPLNLPYFVRAAEGILSRDKDYMWLMHEGVIGGEYYGNEVKPILAAMREGVTPDIALIQTARKVGDFMGRLYNAEDVLFKLAAYKKYIAKGMKPKAAAREVNSWFPNYAELWRATKWMSRMPFGGPFLAFNEQALRITLGRASYRHPIKMVKWAALPGLITTFSVWYLGIDEDEKELLDESRGYFEPLMPWRDKRGAVQSLDLRYIVPMGNELQKMTDYGTGRSDRIEIPFLFQQPPVSGLLDVTYNRDLFTGRSIVKRDDPLGIKMVKVVKHLLRENLPIPSIFIWGRERITRAFKGSHESVHKAIMGALFGVNIRTPYVSRRDAFENIKALAEKDENVSRVVERLLGRDIKTMSHKRLTAQLEYNDRFQDLLSLYNEAYRRVGGPERTGHKEIKTKGILQSIRGGVRRKLKEQDENLRP